MRDKIGRRIVFLAIGMAVFLALYYAGSTTKMAPADSAMLREQFMSQIGDIDETGIFFNNVGIALGMFIPALGAGFGMFSGYSTGLVFSAIADSNAQLSGVSPLVIFLTPFGIMELFAYGLAMSRSGLLVYQLVKKKPWRQYVVPTLIEMGIVVAVLFAAAIVEWWMIENLGGLNLDVPLKEV